MSDQFIARLDLPSFIVMDVMRKAAALERQGVSIMHLEVGQPQTPAPEAARAALHSAIEVPAAHGYTLALGLPRLRQAISAHYESFYGVNVPEDRIIVTLGSSLGFVMTFMTCFTRGNKIALPCPGYPAYRNLLSAFGLELIDIPLRAEQGWVLDISHLQALKEKPDGLILASPMNPTGAMVKPQELASIANYCHDNNIRLISDEIYHGISYGQAAQTAFGLSPSAIVVNSFSKFFSMTGHRIGWMVVPDALIDPLERASQNLLISVPTLGQIAAAAALEKPETYEEMQAHVNRYQRNRDILINGLPDVFLGNYPQPDGAFYLYADCSALGNDSGQIAARLLNEAGVAVTPGADFDPIAGKHALRLSFAGTSQDMEEACARICQWVENQK